MLEQLTERQKGLLWELGLAYKAGHTGPFVLRRSRESPEYNIVSYEDSNKIRGVDILDLKALTKEGFIDGEGHGGSGKFRGQLTQDGIDTVKSGPFKGFGKA